MATDYITPHSEKPPILEGHPVNPEQGQSFEAEKPETELPAETPAISSPEVPTMPTIPDARPGEPMTPEERAHLGFTPDEDLNKMSVEEKLLKILNERKVSASSDATGASEMQDSLLK